MNTGFYRGLAYESDYNLERLDIQSLLEPVIQNALALAEVDGPVTTLTIKDREIKVSSFETDCTWARLFISEHLHFSLLDREQMPENPTTLRCAAPEDQDIMNGVWDLAFGYRAGLENTPIYLNHQDYFSVRTVNSRFIQFALDRDLVKEGLFAWINREGPQSDFRGIFVAPEVPRGYAYLPPSVDLALRPPSTRPEGLQPKVRPEYMALIIP